MKLTTLTASAFALIAMPTLAACGGNYASDASAEKAPMAAEVATADIVDTAAAAGSFNTLLAAAEAAGLVEALKGDGPLTVFAPTDAAFAALPAGTVENLLKPENKDQLAGILKVHVIAGAAITSDQLAGQTMDADTLNGKIMVDGTNGVKINDANVVTADVIASNGVIHVIDKVLMPAS